MDLDHETDVAWFASVVAALMRMLTATFVISLLATLIGVIAIVIQVAR